MAKFLLALDQASQTTGYAVYKGKDLIAHGHKTFNDNDYIVRTAKLRAWVDSLIDSVNGDLEIAIEDIQLQTYGRGSNDPGLQTYKKLAHVQGALLSLFAERNISYHIVLAASWKHTCGVKGRAREEQKANAQKYVKTTFAIDATQDEADAICIGQHILRTNESKVGCFDWS